MCINAFIQELPPSNLRAILLAMKVIDEGGEPTLCIGAILARPSPRALH